MGATGWSCFCLSAPWSAQSVSEFLCPSQARELFVHLVARHDAPEVGGRRVLGPDLRALRIVAVPGPRLEIAQLFVHAVKLGEQLGNEAGRAAVIGEQVVADAVAARPPQ